MQANLSLASVTRVVLVFIIAWALQSCQKQALKPNEDPSLSGKDALSTQYIQDLLHQANEAPPEQQLDLTLTALEALTLGGAHDWARSILEVFPVNTLEQTPLYSPVHGRWALIHGRLESAAGNTPAALSYVSANKVMDNIHFYPQELTDQLRLLRADLLFALGDYTEAINERVILSASLTNDKLQAQANLAALWQTLMELPLNNLTQEAALASTRAHKGWYSLAAISKDNQNNMRGQLDQLDQWQQQWPEHPASLELPADLQLLRELVENQPKSVAVLLPVSGRYKNAGLAIRDGLLAAYYHYRQLDPLAPVLRFYNSYTPDVAAVYDQAIDDGAELVIGPLAKNNILALTNRLQLPVPTLTLNNVDSPLGYIGNMYQFGLGVEDEAISAADKLWRDGHRSALIIAPNNLWGDRCTKAFDGQWQALGAEPTTTFRFEGNNDYSKVIQKALHVDQSNKRAKHIRSIVGSIEFEPRRRQDVDAIYIAAQAEQARQIKPTLAFYYASNIPVYATSQVYNGTNNTKLDKDMNGITFSTLPWYFNQGLEEKANLLNRPDANPKHQALYALGLDAFYLYPRLKQLQAVHGARFYGQTGTLELNISGQITRKQVWAEFSHGRAQQIKNTN